MGGCRIHRRGRCCCGCVIVVVCALWLVVCGRLSGSLWAVVACWWVVVLGAGRGHGWSLAFGLWSLWPLVAICVRGRLLLVVVVGGVAVCHVGGRCQSSCVLLVVVVRRREAVSRCQTNVVCYSSRINNNQINNSTRIPFPPIPGNIPV